MSSEEVVRRDDVPPSVPPTAEAPPAEAVANSETNGGPTAIATETPPASDAPPPPALAAGPADRPRVRLSPFGAGDAQAVPSLGESELAASAVTSGTAPAPPPPPSAPVSVPPKAELDAEIEAEIEAAMASGELGPHGAVPAAPIEPPAEGAPPAPGRPAEEELIRGVRLKGKVASLHGDDVLLDLGYRSTGLVPSKQFEQGKLPEVGAEIEIVVERADPAAGLIHCNLPRSLRKSAGNWESLAVGQIVDCMVNKTNKGGLEVTVSNLRGFLPASQVELGFVNDLEPFVGQKLRVQVTEVNPKKRNLVVSRRAFLMIERQEAEESLWKTLHVGQRFSGRVKTIKDYGAFIDIGGVDGFLHIGEMSWTRIRHPSDVLKEGDQVEVAVVTLDAEKKKISLGIRQLTANPWSTATSKFAVGSTATGTVTRTAEFGAFVELEPGLEGLIHISELDHKRVRKVDDVVKQGDSVEAKVLEVDPDRKRISLSLKALKERPPVEPKKTDEDLAPSAGQPAFQPKRKNPLKGGTGGPTPGGLFGNPRDFH